MTSDVFLGCIVLSALMVVATGAVWIAHKVGLLEDQS